MWQYRDRRAEDRTTRSLPPFAARSIARGNSAGCRGSSRAPAAVLRGLQRQSTTAITGHTDRSVRADCPVGIDATTFGRSPRNYAGGLPISQGLSGAADDGIMLVALSTLLPAAGSRSMILRLGNSGDKYFVKFSSIERPMDSRFTQQTRSARPKTRYTGCSSFATGVCKSATASRV